MSVLSASIEYWMSRTHMKAVYWSSYTPTVPWQFIIYTSTGPASTKCITNTEQCTLRGSCFVFLIICTPWCLLVANPAVGSGDGIWASASVSPGLSQDWNCQLTLTPTSAVPTVRNIIRIQRSIHWYWRDRDNQSSNQINILQKKSQSAIYLRAQVFPLPGEAGE